MSDRCDKHDREKVPLEIGHGRAPLMICEECAEGFEEWISQFADDSYDDVSAAAQPPEEQMQ